MNEQHPTGQTPEDPSHVPPVPQPPPFSVDNPANQERAQTPLSSEAPPEFWSPAAAAPTPMTPQPGMTSSPNKSRRGRTIIAIIVAALIIGASAGTVLVLNHRADIAAQERQAVADRKAEAARQAEAKRQAEEDAKRQAEEKQAAALAAAQAKFNACTQQVGPLLRALHNIDARLDVGLSQEELSDMLGQASIAYSDIEIRALGHARCLTAGARLETAFNQYNSTVSDWSDCIYDYYCDVDDDVLPGMQAKWSKASRLIDGAEGLLKTLDPDSDAYVAADGADAA